MIFRDESSDAVPSYLCDAELDAETIGKALSSPLFVQEREEPDRRQKLITLMKKLCCQINTQERGRPVHELSSCHKQSQGSF